MCFADDFVLQGIIFILEHVLNWSLTFLVVQTDACIYFLLVQLVVGVWNNV